MNYYRRFMGDYANKTADLSLAEHGAYTVLLDISYSTEAGLPGSYDALFRLCRAMSKAEQDAVKLVADRFFPLCADGLRRNPRAADEIAKAQAIIDKQRKSGADSAHKRWSTDRSTHESTDGSTHRSTDPEAIQPPTTNLQPPTANPQPPKKNKGAGSAFAPPVWVPISAWQGFEQMRNKIKKPMTDGARKLIVRELEKLQAQGFDPLAVLEQSERNCWQDVFPLKDKGSPTQSLSAFMDERDKRAAN